MFLKPRFSLLRNSMIKPFKKPIYVTKPFLPPLDEFCQELRKIWETAWLTNNGPILQEFTRELCTYFGTNNVCLFNNGTLALQIGLQGMGISGEVITTPFTFVATPQPCFGIKSGRSSWTSNRTFTPWILRKSKQRLPRGQRPFWPFTFMDIPAN